MKRIQGWMGVAAVLAVVAGPSSARADNDFYSQILRGLSRLSAPTAPSATRNGQFAISYEPFIQGHLLDFRRTFGPDAFGRPNSIDLGVAALTVNSGQLDIVAAYSKRGLPSADLQITTPQIVNYSVNVNTGFQDFSIQNAQFGLTTSLNINALGFYDYTLNATHRGDYTTDGYTLVDGGTLDFDIGPINLSGNVVADGLAAITEPLWASAGLDNPFTKFSARATKEIETQKVIDDLLERAYGGETLSADDVNDLLEATMVKALLAGEAPDFSYLADPVFEASMAAMQGSVAASGEHLNDVLIPEPPTLIVLLAVGVLALRRMRS